MRKMIVGLIVMMAAMAPMMALAASKTPKPAPAPTINAAGNFCCPTPYWPFQSWTHEWTCIKGKTEAKSTWNLYKETDLFTYSTTGTSALSSGIFTLNVPDPETVWYVEYRVEGEYAKCEKFRRKDGLIHSLIQGQEYTQTCNEGKLGLLVPVQGGLAK